MNFLLSLVLSAQPITIIADSGTESRRLKEELHQDWFAFGIDNDTVKWNQYQVELNPRIKWVDSTKPENNRYSYLRSYPIILYGDRHDPIILDPTSFKETSWALTSLYIHIYNQEFDDSDHRRACERAKELYESACLSDSLNWLQECFPEEASEFLSNYYYPDWELQEPDKDMYTDLINKFGGRHGFPSKRRLVLPKSPLMKLPY